tara:strand:- start:1623 stop:1811 length:189 start_codon:yes stop_codon:yes gene_type:complete
VALLSIYTLFAIFLKNWRFEATFPLSIERPTILFEGAGEEAPNYILYLMKLKKTGTLLPLPF